MKRHNQVAEASQPSEKPTCKKGEVCCDDNQDKHHYCSSTATMRGAWWLCTASALLAPIKAPQKRTKRRAVLTVGTPLDWPDALDRLAYVREHGIDQFIEMWRRSQTLKRDDDLLWGDEVEYAVLRVDEHQAKISLRAVHKSYCRDAPTPATMACPWGSLTARFGQLGRVKHPTHWLIYAQVTRPRDPRRARDEGGGALL